MAREYNLSNQQLGWVSLPSSWATCSSSTERKGCGSVRRATDADTRSDLVGGTQLAHAAPLAAAFALPLLLIVRFVLGAGEAVMYPASNRVVAKWIPVSERGIANGLIFMGVGVGAGITPPLVTSVMLRYGWRASFIACGLIGILAGAVWWLIARDSPDAHRSVSASEREHIRAGIPASTSAPPLSWRQIGASRNVWLLTISYFCYGYSAYIFFTWFFIYLSTVRGMQLKESALYAMLPFIAMAIGSVLGGCLNDRLSKCAVSGRGAAGVPRWYRTHRGVYRGRKGRRERPDCQHNLGRWRGNALPGAKFVLVGERGHRRVVGGAVSG